MKKSFMSIVTPCFNEEANVAELVSQVRRVFESLRVYEYEHIFIDNASSDATVSILKKFAQSDDRIKIIVNTRNFGHIRSPYHALMQAKGDAIILLVADLQDPVTLIPEFISRWVGGAKVVLGIKEQAEESAGIFWLRKMYYRLVARLSDVKLVKDNTGFGLYDRVVIEEMRKLDEPYPYFRGMVVDLGFQPECVSYKQPRRKRGVTSQNFWTLYDIAMLGITNHTKFPLRIAAVVGFVSSIFGVLLAAGYLVAKLLLWDKFEIGTAPILIGVFLFSSVQLFFLGIMGEYIGAIYTQVRRRPHVIEKERIGFLDAQTKPNGRIQGGKDVESKSIFLE